jgi:hypothetical protein
MNKFYKHVIEDIRLIENMNVKAFDDVLKLDGHV